MPFGLSTSRSLPLPLLPFSLLAMAIMANCYFFPFLSSLIYVTIWSILQAVVLPAASDEQPSLLSATHTAREKHTNGKMYAVDMGDKVCTEICIFVSCVVTYVAQRLAV